MKNQLARSDSLSEELKDRCAREPVSLSVFMGEAVSQYYATRDPFGASGDFTTAPEISQMFGEVIGAGLLHYWQGMGAPEDIALLELGPGRGTLMSDILRVFNPLLNPPVFLVEQSPVLKSAQAARLSAFSPQWMTDMQRLPPRPLLVVANEFFDALPIRQFQKTKDAWRERGVGWDQGRGFHPVLLPLDGMFSHHLDESFPENKTDDIFELCPSGIAMMGTLAAHLKKFGGCAIVIDYGHIVTALGETLQAVRGHRFASPFVEPGEADITAHVDFGALAATARKEGASVLSLTTQGELLDAWGIGARADRLLQAADARQAADIRSALRRLTDAGEMGTLFKALIIGAMDKNR